MKKIYLFIIVAAMVFLPLVALAQFSPIPSNQNVYYYSATCPHCVKVKEFFDKYGSRAVVFARFLPIVRTFAPVIAGIVEMDRKKFMFYNILGSVLWSVTMIFAGHYLYELFKIQFNIDLKHYIEYIVIGIVLVTTVPVIMKFVRKRK